MEESEKAPPARFCDRLNAFALDASLFSSAYYLTAVACVFVGGPEPFPRFYPVWMALWTALFIAYHAYYAADGRRTLGKRALGLQVVTDDDELPNLPIALARALAYLVSTAFLCLGFVWALFGGRAWHDRIAGTWVAEVDVRPEAARKASAVVAWAVGALLVAGWFFLVVIGPSMARGSLLARGEKGVKSVVYLEHKYREAKGAFTADPAELFKLSEESAQIARELPLYIDLATLRLEARPDGFTVEAAALDEKRTVLRAVEGP